MGGAVLEVEEHVREVESPNRSQDWSWLVLVVVVSEMGCRIRGSK